MEIPKDRLNQISDIAVKIRAECMAYYWSKEQFKNNDEFVRMIRYHCNQILNFCDDIEMGRR